jgi:hypothetical protein
LGAAALDTSVKADPSAVLAAAGYATIVARVLPRWTGWIACAAAAVNLVAGPSVFGGTDYTGFYTASGYVTFIGQAAMFIWFTVATVATLVRRTETPVVVTVDG